MIYTPLEHFSISNSIFSNLNFAVTNSSIYSMMLLVFMVSLLYDVLYSKDHKKNVYILFVIYYSFFLAISGSCKKLVTISLICIFLGFIFLQPIGDFKKFLKKFLIFLFRNKIFIFILVILSLSITDHYLYYYRYLVEELYEYRRLFFYLIPMLLFIRVMNLKICYNRLTKLFFVSNLIIAFILVNYYVALGIFYINGVFQFVPVALCEGEPEYDQELKQFFYALSHAQATTIGRKIGLHLRWWPSNTGYFTTRDMKYDVRAFYLTRIDEYNYKCRPLAYRVFRIRDELIGFEMETENPERKLGEPLVLSANELEQLSDSIISDRVILNADLNKWLILEKFLQKDVEIHQEVDRMVANNVPSDLIKKYVLKEYAKFYANKSRFMNSQTQMDIGSIKNEISNVKERVELLKTSIQRSAERFGQEVLLDHEEDSDWPSDTTHPDNKMSESEYEDDASRGSRSSSAISEF